MPAALLHAHSLAEAYLYLMATPCAACGRGPLKGSDAVRTDARELVVRIDAVCGSCRARVPLHFELAQAPATGVPGAPAVVNDSSDPSAIIDVAQWITLARTIAEAAAREANRSQARHLGLEAAQCFEEALKFFEESNDIPPPTAFFHETSRRRFLDHPEQFSRQRLVELRARLPATRTMRARLTESPRRRRWWPFGKK